MSFGIEGLAAASIDLSLAKVQSSYSTALLKKTMDSEESQAASLIQGMLEAVPAPAQYGFDTWA
jgi:hypothetical protein